MICNAAVQARIQGGGGKGALPHPPPIFWGEQGGQKPHTPKHTKYAQIF